MSVSTKEVMQALEAMGTAQTRKTFTKHGAPNNMFGVKVGDMKSLIKKTGKKNHALAIELYASGNSDAMYFAGLIADEQQMKKADLQRWAEQASWYMLSEFTVAWVAAESPFGWELALKWIDSKKEHVASSGWATLSNLLAYEKAKPADEKLLKSLIDRVEKSLHQSPNRVRYTMNGFLISVGGYVPSLSERAIKAATKIGIVNVDMGGTACKVPEATSYIDKMLARNNGGAKKKKTVRC